MVYISLLKGESSKIFIRNMYMYLAQCLVVVQFIHVALSTANWFAKNVDQSLIHIL